ncbi:MAG: zf-HC2 domain-containing protein [Acidobacteriia bacterium]|nr:zf-HC2 domain-containing protein [Terriglobia bacterium]
MNCKSFEQLIALYAGGDHPEQRTREIEEHLKECPSCRELVEQLKRGMITLNEFSCESVDPSTLQGIRNQVLSRISSETTRAPLEWFRFSPFWKWNYALVAVLVVAILSVALFRLNLFKRSHQEMATMTKKELALPSAPKVTPAPTPSGEPEVQGTQRAGLNEGPVPRPRSNHRVKSGGQTERPTQSRPGPIVSPSFEISQIIPPHIEPFKIEFPKKADPLVVKWVTQDPDIEIIWLVDTKGE